MHYVHGLLSHGKSPPGGTLGHSNTPARGSLALRGERHGDPIGVEKVGTKNVDSSKVRCLKPRVFIRLLN